MSDHGHCPFCGSDQLRSLAGVDGRMNQVAASCDACGARGPARGSLAEAWEAWDLRTLPAVNVGKLLALDRMGVVARLYTAGRNGAQVSLLDGPGIPLVTERSAKKRIDALRKALAKLASIGADVGRAVEAALDEDNHREAGGG